MQLYQQAAILDNFSHAASNPSLDNTSLQIL